MTIELTDAEMRAGLRVAHGPNRQPLAVRTGPAEAARTARAWALAVGSDAGAPR